MYPPEAELKIKEITGTFKSASFLDLQLSVTFNVTFIPSCAMLVD